MNETSLIVIGGLNTDIIAAGVDAFPQPNDPVYGGRLVIGPGGKPGNIASMASTLAPANSVAMIAKTVEDGYGLWRKPVEGLQAAGVNTDYVKVLTADETDLLPSVALLAVDEQGNNLCVVVPGISQDFKPTDIDAATPLFEAAAQNGGMLALTMECPIETTQHAIQKAAQFGIKVILDPGGIVAGTDISELIATKPYLMKPNEFETETITGLTITDFTSAKQAANRLKDMGAQNVLITHGEHGAYLFAEGDEPLHLPIPELPASQSQDATGCGDQAMATLCVALQAGKTLREAAGLAVLAGTMQFQKLGIQPITLGELTLEL